jgi:hypothetical protein
MLDTTGKTKGGRGQGGMVALEKSGTRDKRTPSREYFSTKIIAKTTVMGRKNAKATVFKGWPGGGVSLLAVFEAF